MLLRARAVRCRRVVAAQHYCKANDFSLLYSPFAAGARTVALYCIDANTWQNQRAADRRANNRAFRVLQGKKFITLISIKLYSSYCREVWGSSIKQQFLQGSEVRMREASNRYYRRRIVKRATEQKLVVSQHTTATAEAAAVRPRTKNYHQKKHITTTMKQTTKLLPEENWRGFCIRWRTKE